MAVDHPGIGFSLEQLIRMVRREVVATLQNASIGRAGIRVYDGGWILIEGGGLSVTGKQTVAGILEGSGTLNWTGPWFLRGDGKITGDLNGTGELVWSGPWELRGKGKITGDTTGSGILVWTGPWDLRGNGQIKGNVDVTGALDVKNRLTLGPSGYFEAGTVRIDRGGSYGGRIASSGAVLDLAASGSVVISAENLVARNGSFRDISAIGTVSANIKNFRIPHPVKPDHYLLHGATESPVSGVEYWGDQTLPESGEITVYLPEYFESLTKSEGRVVLVAARGFVADWSDIDSGSFAVSGEPGGRFSWLVKAERKRAEFLVEEPVYGPLRE